MNHINSVRSWQELDRDSRAYLVCERLHRIGKPATDRQLCESLGFGDMNAVRPTITQLVAAKHLAEVGSVSCPKTRRTVRKVWFAALAETLFG